MRTRCRVTWRARAALWASLLALLAAVFAAGSAHALDAIEVSEGTPALDLTDAVERLAGENGKLTVSAAPDAEGVVRRIEVLSRSRPSTDEWAVFALANASDEQVDRLLVAPHHRLAGSGWWRPDLGASRILAITPSEGAGVERRANGDADMFLVTLDPGATITFAAELAGTGLPQLTLWEPDAWRDRADAFTLFHGIVLGIGGLLAVFLTVLFVVRGQAMFPAAAALAWGVVAYAALDFGFVEQVAPLAPADERRWRALLELLIAGGFVAFLFAYLALFRWDRRAWWVFVPWVAALAALVAVATFDPALAATGARLSLALSAAFGLGLVAVLSALGSDRAVLLVPTWLLVAAWTVAAGAVVAGALDTTLDTGPDTALAQPALIGGLALLVLLVAFTVTQHAFAGTPGALGAPGTIGMSGATAVASNVSELERRALALAGSGDAVFDWDVEADRIRVDEGVADALGLDAAALNGARGDWLPHLHPADRDRFVGMLDALRERARGRADMDLRLRGADGPHRCFNLRARPVVDAGGRVVRCTGTLADVTRERAGRDELLRDAVHDNLTGLALREILLDRTRAAVALAGEGEALRPALLIVDLDRFAHVNETFGLQTGDGVLLSVARRLVRIARPQDCAARLGGDRFALLLLSRPDPDGVAAVAERVREAVLSPVAHAGAQIALTASIGVASWAPDTDAATLIADAELAVEEAKRAGGDRVVPFRPAMRAFGTRDYHLENDLRRALERDEMVMLFQPIVRLDTGAVVGFEALMRWKSALRGLIGPADFIPLAERSGLIEALGAFALERAAAALEDWRLAAPDLFVSVNVSSRQLVRHELIDGVREVVARHALPPGALKLEITESLVMENPERAALVLERVREAGAGLALDDFGTGYSSLSHLTRFPFDTLKIDRSLVKGSEEGRRDGRGAAQRPAILRAVARMARDLGLDAVAEGAETPGDADALRALDVPFAQGFLFGEAMDAAAAGALVRREAKRARKRPPATAADDADAGSRDDAEPENGSNGELEPEDLFGDGAAETQKPVAAE